MDFRTVIVWEKLIIALKCSHLWTLKVSHDSPAMKSFFGLLNIKPCPLYLNNSKLHLMLCSITHHTQFKIPSNRPSLIKCSLFNCREMNICWFWQAGLVLEITSQSQKEESPSEAMTFLKCLWVQLMTCFADSDFPYGKWNLGSSELEVQATSGHLTAGLFWNPQCLKRQMLSWRSSSVTNGGHLFFSQGKSWVLDLPYLNIFRGRIMSHESLQQEFCNQATRGQGNMLTSHLYKGNYVGAVFW